MQNNKIFPRWTAHQAAGYDRKVSLVFDGTKIKTAGLSPMGFADFKLDVEDPVLLDYGRDYLTTLIRYVIEGGNIVKEYQTVACGVWLLQASLVNEHLFALNELKWDDNLNLSEPLSHTKFRTGGKFAISLLPTAE